MAYSSDILTECSPDQLSLSSVWGQWEFRFLNSASDWSNLIERYQTGDLFPVPFLSSKSVQVFQLRGYFLFLFFFLLCWNSLSSSSKTSCHVFHLLFWDRNMVVVFKKCELPLVIGDRHGNGCLIRCSKCNVHYLRLKGSKLPGTLVPDWDSQCISSELPCL